MVRPEAHAATQTHKIAHRMFLIKNHSSSENDGGDSSSYKNRWEDEQRGKCGSNSFEVGWHSPEIPAASSIMEASSKDDDIVIVNAMVSFF